MSSFIPTHWCACTAAVLLTAASGTLAAQGLDFNAALQAAAQRAPTLQAQMASLQGASALQISAAQLPDPRLSIGIDSLPINGPDRGSLTRDDFTQRQIGWEQMVPNRAKRAARTDAAQARTARESALLQTEQLAVQREAGLAWLARYFAERRLALLGELDAHQTLLVATAPSQLAAGKINAADLTAISLETLTLADRRDELQREADQASIVLRRWTGQDADGTLTGNAPVFKVDAGMLLANVEKSPEIAALTPLVAMAQADMREAEAAKAGDWSWSVRYGKRGPAYSDLISVMFSFELPVLPAQRQQPQVVARQKEVERIDAQYQELLRRQTQEVQTLLAENNEIERKLDRTTRQAQPLAAQRTALTLASYQSGREPLANVLQARKQQTDIGLRTIELQARQAAVQWRLNTIVSKATP